MVSIVHRKSRLRQELVPFGKSDGFLGDVNRLKLEVRMVNLERERLSASPQFQDAAGAQDHDARKVVPVPFFQSPIVLSTGLGTGATREPGVVERLFRAHTVGMVWRHFCKV